MHEEEATSKKDPEEQHEEDEDFARTSDLMMKTKYVRDKSSVPQVGERWLVMNEESDPAVGDEVWGDVDGFLYLNGATDCDEYEGICYCEIKEADPHSTFSIQKEGEEFWDVSTPRDCFFSKAEH